MNTFTTPQNAQVINITGNVKIALIDNQILQNGDFIKAGDQLILAKGSEIVLAFADGTQQTLYGGPGEIAPVTDSEFDAILAGEAPPDTAPPTDALDDIAAIQALIEAGDEEIDLPATAAGGDTGNEGLDFITLERSGAETLAESGFDTTGLDPAAALAGEEPALNTELDAIPPTLTITSSAPNTDQNDQSLITFEFSEDVTGFTESDVNVNIGTLTDFTQIDGDTWTAIFTPEPATDLTAVISVADDTYTDLAGNNGSGDSIDIISLDAPTLTESDTATVNEDSPATGNVLDNDSDADDELTVATFTVAGDTTIYQNGETATVEGGSLTINEDGSYIFTPADDYNGTLPVITYTTNTGASDTLTITVEPINDPPVALDDTASGNEGDTITILAGGAISVLANDSDVDGNPLIVTDFTQPANGSVTVNSDGTFSYVHNGGETTSDSFTYTVSDGQGGTDTATVNLSIAAVNDAPDAVDDAASGNEGGTITVLTGGAISVLANDSDADGNSLTVASFTQPANGSVTVNEDGTFSYVHNGGETTSDSFTYTVSDGQGGTDTATVNLSIAGVNDAPNAVNDAGSGIEGGTITILTGGAISVLANDSDAEGNPLTVTSFTQPGNGSVTVNDDGTFSYVHNGGESTSDSFTYTVSDGQGGTDTATVNLSIAAVNDAPVVSSSAINVDEESTDTGLGLSAPTDADGDSLTITVTGLPVLGIVTLADGNPIANGQTLTSAQLVGLQYDAPADYNGTDTVGSFTYRVDDGQSEPNSIQNGATTITVNPVNDAPVVDSTAINVDEESTDTGLGLGAPTDADGDSLTITVTGLPVLGIVTLADGNPIANGQTLTSAQLVGLQYDAPADYNGTDTVGSFTYSVDDGQSEPNSIQNGATTITVNPINDPPTIVLSDGSGEHEVFEAGLPDGTGVGSTTKEVIGSFVISDQDGRNDLSHLIIGNSLALSITELQTALEESGDDDVEVIGTGASAGDFYVTAISNSGDNGLEVSYKYILTTATADDEVTPDKIDVDINSIDSFDVSVSDDDGTSFSEPITINVTIADDAPVDEVDESARPIVTNGDDSVSAYGSLFDAGADGIGVIAGNPQFGFSIETGDLRYIDTNGNKFTINQSLVNRGGVFFATATDNPATDVFSIEIVDSEPPDALPDDNHYNYKLTMLEDIALEQMVSFDHSDFPAGQSEDVYVMNLSGAIFAKDDPDATDPIAHISGMENDESTDVNSNAHGVGINGPAIGNGQGETESIIFDFDIDKEPGGTPDGTTAASITLGVGRNGNDREESSEISSTVIVTVMYMGDPEKYYLQDDEFGTIGTASDDIPFNGSVTFDFEAQEDTGKFIQSIEVSYEGGSEFQVTEFAASAAITELPIEMTISYEATDSDGDQVLFGNEPDGEFTIILKPTLSDDILIATDEEDIFTWLEGDTGTDHILGFDITEDVLDLSDLLVGATGETLDDYLDFSFGNDTTTIKINADGTGTDVNQIIILDVDLSVYAEDGGSDVIGGLLNTYAGAPVPAEDPTLNLIYDLDVV